MDSQHCLSNTVTITTKNNVGQVAGYCHPLMHNNINRADLDALIAYLQEDQPRLTQGHNVQKFEEEWSNWLGVRHSVFVNSGSSANLITLAVLKQIYGVGEVIVPPLTWVSDIASVLHNGFQPIFVDINPRTLALDTTQVLECITENTKAVFLTHVQGFNGLTQGFVDDLQRRGIPLIEDVCESHGATIGDKKLGSIGLMSNFSFYFAHHMSTIEGGMVCTDDEQIYQTLRMYRSHGMVRESSNDDVRQKYSRENPSLNPDFIFAYPGYNVRNTELGAVIGRSQLKLLDENNEKRKHNHDIFLRHLNDKRFRTDFELTGSCNYAFNVILNQPDSALGNRIEETLNEAGVEYRRGSSGGGNQMRQPYLSGIVESGEWENYPQVEHVHFFGWYIGNFPGLEQQSILHLCGLLNNA